MGLRAKSKRRLLLLVGGLVLVSGSLGGAFYWRKVQLRHEIEAFKPAGLKAYHKGDYVTALHALGPYLQLHGDDIEVLKAYLDVRLKLPEARGHHLGEAIPIYRTLINADPADEKYKRELLSLFVRVGMNTEAVQLADELLATHKDDAEAMQNKSRALLGLGKLSDALEVAEAALKTNPTNVQVAQLSMVIRKQQNQTGELIMNWVTGLEKGRENDPRGMLILAMVNSAVGNQKEAQELAKRVAQSNPASEEEAEQALTLLEFPGIDLYDEARAYLDRTRKLLKSEDLTEQYYRRLVYSEQYEEVARNLAEPAMETNKNTTLTALRIIALCESGKKSEAQPLLQVLQDLGSRVDFVADDWHDVLNLTYFTERPKQRQMIETCVSAFERSNGEAFFQMFLGESYAKSGDLMAALDRWAVAARRAPSWAKPFYLSASAYVAVGNFGGGLDFARAADKRLPHRHDTQVTLAQAWSRMVGRPGAGTAEEFLTFLQRTQKEYPDDEVTAPLQVLLLDKMQRSGEAKQVVRRVLDRKPPATQSLLLAMSQVTRYVDEALAEECLQECESLYGKAVELVVVRCQLMLQSGKTAEAREYLENAIKVSTTNKAEWEIVRCQFLEQTKDDEAHNAWKGLYAQFPDDTTVLWSMLRSMMVRKDHATTGSVLERLKEQVGDSGLSWRLEKARWLLEEATSDSKKEAMAILIETVRTSPSCAPARELLAIAYDAAGSARDATLQLSAATDADPENLQLKLELAQMYLKQGETPRARQVIKTIATAANVTDKERMQCGMLLAQSGDQDIAIELLEKTAQLDETGQAKLVLASLYWQRKDNEKASALFKQLLEKPTADVVAQAASFYLSCGDTAAADKAISLLGALKLEPGQKELAEGSYDVQRGAIKEAQTLLKQATALNLKSTNIWRWYLVSLLAEKDNAEVLNAAASARNVVADDAIIELAKGSTGMSRLLQDDAGRGYVMNCVLKPEDAKGIDKVALAMVSGGKADAADKISQVALQNRQSLPLQILAIRKLLEVGKTQDALPIAREAMARHPNSPLSALYASTCYALLGKWDEALDAAQRWRGMAHNALAPDVMIANAYIGLNRGAEAAKILGDLLKDKDLSKPEFADMATLLAQAMAEQGDIDGAGRILWPLVEKHDKAQVIWMGIGGLQITDLAKAKAWMERLEQVISPERLDMQAGLALSWYRLGDRLKDAAARNHAYEIMDSVVQSTKVDRATIANLAFQLALSMDTLNDLEHAEAYYRVAYAQFKTSKDKRMLPAGNNLAMVLLRSGEVSKLDEALEIANRTANDADPKVATYFDTLSLAYAKKGQYSEAIEAAKQAAGLEQSNVDWKLNLGDLYLKASNKDAAKEIKAWLSKQHLNVEHLNSDQKEKYERLQSVF